MGSSQRRGIEDEVLRVRAVTYLQGATGHGVLSLTFLVFAGAGYRLQADSLAVGGLVSALLLSANGFSIYLWDAIQKYVFENHEPADDATPERALSAPTLSIVHRAELTAGLVQVTGLVSALLVVFAVYQEFGAETGSVLLGIALTAANAGALVVAGLR